MLNLNHLRYVKETAATASFSRAADRCRVTQPTLSNAVAQLEEHLGEKIFRRTTRRVALTRFGEQAMPLIEEVLAAARALEGAAESYHNPTHKLIRVGLSPLVGGATITGLLTPFQSRNPAVEIFFKQCFVGDLEGRLASGSIDAALLPRHLLPATFERTPMHREPLFLLPRQTGLSPPGERGPVSLAQSAQEPIILTEGCGLAEVIRDLYAGAGLSFRDYPGKAMNYQAVEEWSGLGLGAGILPGSQLSAANAAARPILAADGAPAQVHFEMIWSPESHSIDHVQAFRAHLEAAGTR